MMKNALIGLLAIVLVFGMMVVGCDDDSTGEEDTWSNVTSLSQLNGTWKAPSSMTLSTEGIKVTANYTNYLITFNSANKTMSASGTVTATFSGGGIADLWADMKVGFGYMGQMEGVTVSFNDSNYSYTMTVSNLVQEIPDGSIQEMGLKINQNGTKLKMSDGMFGELIYTKQ